MRWNEKEKMRTKNGGQDKENKKVRNENRSEKEKGRGIKESTE